MRFYIKTALFATLFLSFITSATAQISLNNVPAWEGNSRFYSDVISEVKHPSLTLNGFDSGTSGHGFGLKQVLEQAYDDGSGGPVVEVYDEIRDLASDNGNFHPTPGSRRDIIDNTQRMQARAFIALATYVIKRNGESMPGDLPSHSTAMGRLHSALLNPDAWRIVKDWRDDGVKWTGVLQNMARTLDLYLALENAYCHYGAQGHTLSQQECSGATNNRLLSQSEKRSVFSHFANQMLILEDSKNWNYPLGGIIVDRYHGEPGNASLKIQTAIGYAALTYQNVAYEVTPGVYMRAFIPDFVRRALSANLRPAGTNRKRYWGYQTDDGKRFWGEGPYYLHFALGDVLPFWHAVRINDMLGSHPSFNAPDPFTTSRFTEPLHWLADLVTPDGMTPPLDDGNKHNMKRSMLLRWTGAYGEAALGQKFAWIR